jgi:hypothetical protein
MISRACTTIPASDAAAVEGSTAMNRVNVPSSLFTDEQIRKGMIAEAGPWKLFAESVRALFATPYVAVLFFANGTNSAVDGIFPRTIRVRRLAELMGQTAILPPCREIARRFPGLLSMCCAVRACSCPLRTSCGAGRVDAIRLESHGSLLGDLMLFAETGTPISGKASDSRTNFPCGVFSNQTDMRPTGALRPGCPRLCAQAGLEVNLAFFRVCEAQGAGAWLKNCNI